LFDFDEDTQEPEVYSNTMQEHHIDLEGSNQDSSSEDEEILTKITEPSLEVYGSSIPISIPMDRQLYSQTYQPKLKVSKSNKTEKDEQEEEKPKNEDEELLSKSFDVPFSHNRRVRAFE